jgi:hypothetical protein
MKKLLNRIDVCLEKQVIKDTIAEDPPMWRKIDKYMPLVLIFLGVSLSCLFFTMLFLMAIVYQPS